MDSASQTFSVDQIADLVVERLMEKSGSLANLGTATLDSIEERTLESVDQITRDVISKLLGKQAQLDEVPVVCPTCGGKLCSKPPQGRSLQSRRGSLHFKTEVAHCEACRLDFFSLSSEFWGVTSIKLRHLRSPEFESSPSENRKALLTHLEMQ